jgi:hypothetical protein
VFVRDPEIGEVAQVADGALLAADDAAHTLALGDV